MILKANAVEPILHSSCSPSRQWILSLDHGVAVAADYLFISLGRYQVLNSIGVYQDVVLAGVLFLLAKVIIVNPLKSLIQGGCLPQLVIRLHFINIINFVLQKGCSVPQLAADV